MSYNEWSFLSERITETNPETNYALLNFNSVFVNSPEGDEILRDQLLLKFKQRLWKIPDQIENEIVTPYYGMFYKQKDDQVPFLIHDLIFQDQLKEKYSLLEGQNFLPTLSFRTLIYDDQHHVKFGLPIHYGAVIRLNKKEEVLTSMYLSDYIKSTVSIPKLEFFSEYKGYSIKGIEDYSVSYRKRKSTEKIIPFGCYFNKLLNHSNDSPEKSLDETLLFLEGFFKDLNLIYIDLINKGLGLEIHGQNLMIKLKEDGTPMRSYLYRDLGTSTLSQEKYSSQIKLNEYYLTNYNFKFTQQIDPGYFAWMNYRVFFISFILYNLDHFSHKNKLSFNSYNWFEDSIKMTPFIRQIY